MNTEKTSINKYVLNFNKKSIIDFFKFFQHKKEGRISHRINELLKVSSLGKKEIQFLLDFSVSHRLMKIDKNLYKFSSNDTPKNYFIETCKYYFNIIYSDKDIHENIFKKSKISLENDFIVIDGKSISLNYSPILTTLSRIEFLQYKGDNAFIKNFILAKKLLERPLRKLKKSQKEYEQDLFNKSERGKLAEIFVLNFEIEKLKSLKLKPIRQSVDDVGLGYDVLSFDEDGNEMFIEVKSILNKRFYWSENEVDASKKYGKNYYIYCVKFKNGVPDSISKIICNPYKEIFINNAYDIKEVKDYIIYL